MSSSPHRTKRTKIFIDTAMKNIAREHIVLDVGGGERFGKWMKEYEPLFSACDYRTLDYDASTGADVVGDIHAIPLPEGSVDAVICSSVLEHVREPYVAMNEITRILRKGGKLFLYVPSIYPYHARKGHYPDYWRFFGDTVEELTRGFAEVTIEKQGGYFYALSFFVPMQHRLRWFLVPLAEALDTVFQTEKRTTTSGYYVYAAK